MNTKQFIWTLLSIFLFVPTLEAKLYYVTSKVTILILELPFKRRGNR